MTRNIDETTEEIAALEIYLSAEDTPVVGDDGLVWKEVLREGEWAFRPGAGQTPVRKPLRVVAGHADNPLVEIGFADLIEAYEDGAVDHVTIPTSHADKPEENTGFVKALEVREVDGSKRLYAGMHFTEPEIKEKALRGTIANTSVGVIFDYIKKSSGKVYKQALGHVALTNKPWINGMKPFGVTASEDVDETEIASVVIEPENEVLEGLKMENVADFDAAKELIIQRAKETGNTSWLPEDWQDAPANEESTEDGTSDNEDKETNDMSDKNSSTEEEVQEREEETPASETVLSEEVIDNKISEATSAFETKLSEKDAEVAELKRQLHEKSVAEKISNLKSEGFSEFPGLLKEIEELYLADEGTEVASLTLSEEVDGKTQTSEVKLSVSGLVDRIVECLPRENGKLNFGEQANEFQNFGEREAESDPTTDPVAKAAELSEFFGREFPTKEGN